MVKDLDFEVLAGKSFKQYNRKLMEPFFDENIATRRS